MPEVDTHNQNTGAASAAVGCAAAKDVFKAATDVARRSVHTLFAHTSVEIEAARRFARHTELQRERVRRYLDGILAGQVQTKVQAALLREIAVGELRHGKEVTATAFRGAHYESLVGDVRADRDSALEEAFREMAKPDEWGTSIELAAAFEAFDQYADKNRHAAIRNRTIKIFTPGKDAFALVKKEGDDIYLYNNNVHWEDADSDGNTYTTTGDGSCLYHAIAKVAATEMKADAAVNVIETTEADVGEATAAVNVVETTIVDAGEATADITEEVAYMPAEDRPNVALGDVDHAAYSHKALMESQITASGMPTWEDLAQSEAQYHKSSKAVQEQIDRDHTFAIRIGHAQLEGRLSDADKDDDQDWAAAGFTSTASAA